MKSESSKVERILNKKTCVDNRNIVILVVIIGLLIIWK